MKKDFEYWCRLDETQKSAQEARVTIALDLPNLEEIDLEMEKIRTL